MNTRTGILLLILLVLLFVFFATRENESLTGRELTTQMDYTLRGLRNKNPMNVEYVPGNPWLGEIGNDGRFAKFEFHWQGIRAGMVNYFQDYNVDGLHTLVALGEDNTPASDNPGSTVGQYGRGLGSKMGIDPKEPFDMEARKYDLAKAIIKLEIGFNPYWESTIQKGTDAAETHARERGWIK